MESFFGLLIFTACIYWPIICIIGRNVYMWLCIYSWDNAVCCAYTVLIPILMLFNDDRGLYIGGRRVIVLETDEAKYTYVRDQALG